MDPPDGDGAGNAGLPRYFRRNVITSYLRTGSTALVSLVMTPVLVAGLGKEAFGIWVVVTSLAVYRDLLQFGFQNATPKYVAEFSALGDHERLRGSIATAFWFLTGSGIVALVLGLGLAVVFPDLFGVSEDLRTSSQILVAVVVLDFAVGLPCATFSGTMVGFQRFDLMNTTIAVSAVVQAAAMTIVIVLGGGLVALGITSTATSLATQAWRYLLARRLVPGLSVSPRRAHRDLLRPFAGLSIWYGIEDAAYIVVSRIDTIVVGLVLGAVSAGVYSVGQRLALALAQLAQPVAGMFFPHSSELAARGDTAGLRKSFLTGTRLILGVIAPLALTLAILAGPIIEVWVGADFDGGAPVTVFLCAAVTVWVLIDTGVTMLLGTGRARFPALTRISEAGLNLALSVLLANLIGVKGVALATLLAAASLNLIALLPYVCRQFEIRLWDFARPIITAHGPPAAVALLVGWLVTLPDPTAALAVFGAGVAIVSAYVAVFAISGLDSAERSWLLARIRRTTSRQVPAG